MKPKLIARVAELHEKQNKYKRLTDDEKFIVYLVDRCQELENKVVEQDKRIGRMWRLEEMGKAIRHVIKDMDLNIGVDLE